MTIAKQFASRFAKIGYAVEGSQFLNYMAVERFWTDCHKASTRWVETCPQSYDSPRIFQFEDGSVLKLSNPRQEAYPAFVSTSDEWAQYL